MAIVDKLLLKLSPKTVIERSRFFDKSWYKEKYGIETDPAKHYLEEGWKLDYDPSDRFSSKDYLINNPDIQGINPLLHYEVFGKNEGRRPFVPKKGTINNQDVERIEIPYEEYYREMESKKVVSFDVFDTLVMRPFVKADELFSYMEIAFDKKGFREARINAEAESRRTLNKEVKIDDIYQFIDREYQELKEYEIRLEIAYCHINPMIRPVYEKARELGKRVIAVSDMYLPENIEREILDSSLYDMDAVYVSCDYDKTKGSGKLFDFVCQKENIKPEEMVHFGDNYISDYSEAINHGISAFQTPKIVDYEISEQENQYLLSFHKQNDSLGSSIYLSTASEYLAQKKEDPFFKKLGYLLGGPLAYAYLNFVCEKAKEDGIEELLFVSRDGYCLKEIYEKYFYEQYKIPCAYAYLSRAAIYSGALENHLCDDLEKVLSIARIYNSEFDKDHIDPVTNWSKRQSENLQNHLENITKGFNRIATVDMFSGNYTSQKGAAYYLGDRLVKGFYAGNFAECDLSHECFAERLLGMRDNLPVKMSEFLITSYESPIIGVDENGKPVYEYDQSEIKNERYLQIKEGIIDYIDDQRHFFEPKKECLLSLEEWIDLTDAYLRDCSEEEIELLSQIIDSENPVSSNNDKTIADLIRSYRELGY